MGLILPGYQVITFNKEIKLLAFIVLNNHICVNSVSVLEEICCLFVPVEAEQQ